VERVFRKAKEKAEAKAKELAEKKKKENADLIAKNNSNPTLKKGDKNDNVKVLQIKLNLAADGSFGNKTYEAVKAFQSKNGLVADGVVGKATWDKLNGPAETKRVLDAFPITREVPKLPTLAVPTNLDLNKLPEVKLPQIPAKLPDIPGSGLGWVVSHCSTSKLVLPNDSFSLAAALNSLWAEGGDARQTTSSEGHHKSFESESEISRFILDSSRVGVGSEAKAFRAVAE
jgi:hypothetical protein